MGPTCLNGIVLAVCRSQAQAFNRSRLKDSGDLASHRVRLPGGFFNSVRHWAGSSILSADQVTADEHEANSHSLLQRCRIRSVLAALPKRAILMSGRPFIRERR
jgi:hypothetical protein